MSQLGLCLETHFLTGKTLAPMLLRQSQYFLGKISSSVEIL